MAQIPITRSIPGTVQKGVQGIQKGGRLSHSFLDGQH